MKKYLAVLIIIFLSAIFLPGCFNKESVVYGPSPEEQCEIPFVHLYLFPAMSGDEAFEDTFYKVWMDDSYIGEYEANRFIPVNEMPNEEDEFIEVNPGEHLKFIVDVRDKEKNGRFIYNELVEMRVSCQGAQHVIPNLQTSHLARIYVENTYDYDYELLEDGHLFDKSELDLIFRLSGSSNLFSRFKYFGCDFPFGTYRDTIRFYQSGMPVRVDDAFFRSHFEEVVKLDVTLDSEIELSFDLEYNLYSHYNEHQEKQLLTCGFLDTEWYRDNYGQINYGPYDDRGKDLGQKNQIVTFGWLEG